MTWDPAFVVPEDSAVTAAMLMKNHNIGSVPVVSDRIDRELVGIITDRDLTIRVVAEQRDYYRTRVSDVMSKDLVACHVDDDRDEVISAMAKRQIRRVPVVTKHNRLVGIISQADLAGSLKPRILGQLVEEVSEPASEHDKGGLTSTLLMAAGGLGLGMGLVYLINPEWARETTQQIVGQIRSTAGLDQT